VRVAAVDLGTNTTRLLVADVVDDHVEEVRRESRITRLGEGVDARGRLLPVPIARVRNVLSDYRRTVEELGAERTLAFATSAVRDAENGEAFLGEIEWSYGFATRLLTGDEEAQLAQRGVGELAPHTLILDIGGGSTELIVDDFHVSVDVGSVRLTERYLHTDPPTADELAACAQAIELPALKPTAAVGVGGTVTTIAAQDLGLAEYDRTQVHGHVLTRDAARAQLERLAAMPLAERRELPAMEPERAPVIVAGAVILAETLDRYRLDAIEVSEFDNLDGAVRLAAELDAPQDRGVHTCC
jgi:exopolyphosphatase/guanosine-5'-triphosphate,3'-diphosphate pyrophosphatase